MDKIDCLKFLSQTYRLQINENRKYEWKMIFSLLSFYVVCSAASLGGKIFLPNNIIFKWTIYIIFFGLAFSMVSSLLKLELETIQSQINAEDVEKNIKFIVNGVEIKALYIEDTTFRKKMGVVFLIKAITLVLSAMASAIFVTNI